MLGDFPFLLAEGDAFHGVVEFEAEFVLGDVGVVDDIVGVGVEGLVPGGGSAGEEVEGEEDGEEESGGEGEPGAAGEAWKTGAGRSGGRNRGGKGGQRHGRLQKRPWGRA